MIGEGLFRGLAVGGLFSLAVITLQDRGASAMYATPGRYYYWCAVLVPLLLLMVRLLSSARPMRLPSPAWLALCTTATAALLIAGVASPYRGPVMLWTCAPLAGIALFLVLHDWLQEPYLNAAKLSRALAAIGTTLMLTAAGYWIVNQIGRPPAEIFSSTLFEGRLAQPLGHSNYTAGLALLSLPWLVIAARNSRGRLRGAGVAASALTLAVLFMSGSRGGILGLAALGAAGVAATRPGWRRFWRLCAVMLIAAGLIAVANPRIRALLKPGDPQTAPNVSTVQRSAMLTAGWKMGADRPLTGWGLHSTPLVYPRYRAGLPGGADSVLQLHSTPVELWAGLGLPGIILLGTFVGLAARNWARAPVAAASLAGYGAFSLTDYQLDVPLFICAVAALAAPLAGPGSPVSQRQRRVAGGILLLTLALIVGVARPDSTPGLNAAALAAAREPQGVGYAVGVLQRSLELNPSQELPHFNLGWLLLVSDPTVAERHFRAAIELVPDKGGVYFGLGLALLNQGKTRECARAFALECVNDPRFMASPWWTEAAINAQAKATRVEFRQMLAELQRNLPQGSWAAQQAGRLKGLEEMVGMVSPGPEIVYRRERIGYAVLMRNQDLGSVVDLYDVREDPRFPARVPFDLPPKGWVPTPALLKLLDGAPSPSH